MEEQYNIEKEFCEYYGIHHDDTVSVDEYKPTWKHIKLHEILSKFKKYCLMKGTHCTEEELKYNIMIIRDTKKENLQLQNRIKELEAELQKLKQGSNVYTEKQIFDLSTQWAQPDPDDTTAEDPHTIELIRRSYEKGFKDCLHAKQSKFISVADIKAEAFRRYPNIILSRIAFENGTEWLQDQQITW